MAGVPIVVTSDRRACFSGRTKSYFPLCHCEAGEAGYICFDNEAVAFAVKNAMRLKNLLESLRSKS